MTSRRKVDNKDPMRHKVLKYLREHRQELQYIIGSFLAKNPKAREKISKQYEESKDKFTQKEIKVLKKMAQDQIFINETFFTDDKGKPLPYRNRFETWDDAYNNLKAMGFSHDDIINRIGFKSKQGGKNDKQN